MVKIRDRLTLKACRIIAGIKAEELACAAGVTVDTYYKWERGGSFPNMPQINKIIQCYAENGFYVEMNEINFF